MSYCETFLSGSEESSTIQESYTKPRLARIHHSKRKIVARGSAVRMHYLSVALLVEFADADTAQKADYWADTDNRSDNRCIITPYTLL